MRCKNTFLEVEPEHVCPIPQRASSAPAAVSRGAVSSTAELDIAQDAAKEDRQSVHQSKSEKWEQCSLVSTKSDSENSNGTDAASMSPAVSESPTASRTPLSRSAKTFMPGKYAPPAFGSMVGVVVVPTTWRACVPTDVLERFAASVELVANALRSVVSTEVATIHVEENSNGWSITVKINDCHNIHEKIQELLHVAGRALPRYHTDKGMSSGTARQEPLLTEPGFVAYLVQGQCPEPLKRGSCSRGLASQYKQQSWQASVKVSILLG